MEHQDTHIFAPCPRAVRAKPKTDQGFIFILDTQDIKDTSSPELTPRPGAVSYLEREAGELPHGAG
jgi:hypothetical protein